MALMRSTLLTVAVLLGATACTPTPPSKAQGSLQAFSDSYKGSPLNAFDKPFMELAMRFPALRVEYLKRNIEQFRE